jgi:uncharacterized LabA/DUF88 family protein
MVSVGTCALFVDAGFLWAAASRFITGSRGRRGLRCDHPALTGALVAFVEAHSEGMRYLRTYWYDAGVAGRFEAEHRRLSSVPYVTVRLGRLTGEDTVHRRQKGVDVLLYRDLTDLARRRSIDRAYLLAGDGDLRPAVEDSKDLGVQVALIGMPINQSGHNQSRDLVSEADDAKRSLDAALQPARRGRSGRPP